MELFLDEANEECEKEDLRKVLSYVPASSVVLARMLQLADCAADKTDDEILELVTKDLAQKRRIIERVSVHADILELIDHGKTVLTTDKVMYREAATSELDARFDICVADFCIARIQSSGKIIRTICDAFYGIASNQNVQWALTSELIDLGVDLGIYFDLYRIGVDYSLDDSRIVIMNHREAMRR